MRKKGVVFCLRLAHSHKLPMNCLWFQHRGSGTGNKGWAYCAWEHSRCTPGSCVQAAATWGGHNYYHYYWFTKLFPPPPTTLIYWTIFWSAYVLETSHLLACTRYIKRHKNNPIKNHFQASHAWSIHPSINQWIYTANCNKPMLLFCLSMQIRKRLFPSGGQAGA
jgi:hypothetical protein